VNVPSDSLTIVSGLRFFWTPWSLGLSLLLWAVIATVCLAGWWRSGFRPGYGLLELLRLLIATLVLVLFNQPEWVTEQRPSEKPTIAILIDDSQSMDTVDAVKAATEGQGPSPAGNEVVSRKESVAALVDNAF